MKTMHPIKLGLLLVCTLGIGSSRALDLEGSPDRGFGAGVMLGEPTGISLKYWLSENSAVDGVVGWSFADDDDFQVHADYLYHLFELIPVKQDRMPLYFGGGLRYKHRDGRDDLFGFRTVVGISYMFDDIPLDIFAEAGPILDVTPDVEVRYSVGIGARYWFK